MPPSPQTYITLNPHDNSLIEYEKFCPDASLVILDDSSLIQSMYHTAGYQCAKSRCIYVGIPVGIPGDLTNQRCGGYGLEHIAADPDNHFAPCKKRYQTQMPHDWSYILSTLIECLTKFNQFGNSSDDIAFAWVDKQYRGQRVIPDGKFILAIRLEGTYFTCVLSPCAPDRLLIVTLYACRAQQFKRIKKGEAHYIPIHSSLSFSSTATSTQPDTTPIASSNRYEILASQEQESEKDDVIVTESASPLKKPSPKKKRKNIKKKKNRAQKKMPLLEDDISANVSELAQQGMIEDTVLAYCSLSPEVRAIFRQFYAMATALLPSLREADAVFTAYHRARGKLLKTLTCIDSLIKESDTEKNPHARSFTWFRIYGYYITLQQQQAHTETCGGKLCSIMSTIKLEPDFKEYYTVVLDYQTLVHPTLYCLASECAQLSYFFCRETLTKEEAEKSKTQAHLSALNKTIANHFGRYIRDSLESDCFDQNLLEYVSSHYGFHCFHPFFRSSHKTSSPPELKSYLFIIENYKPGKDELEKHLTALGFLTKILTENSEMSVTQLFSTYQKYRFLYTKLRVCILPKLIQDKESDFLQLCIALGVKLCALGRLPDLLTEHILKDLLELVTTYSSRQKIKNQQIAHQHIQVMLMLAPVYARRPDMPPLYELYDNFKQLSSDPLELAEFEYLISKALQQASQIDMRQTKEASRSQASQQLKQAFSHAQTAITYLDNQIPRHQFINPKKTAALSLLITLSFHFFEATHTTELMDELKEYDYCDHETQMSDLDKAKWLILIGLLAEIYFNSNQLPQAKWWAEHGLQLVEQLPKHSIPPATLAQLHFVLNNHPDDDTHLRQACHLLMQHYSKDKKILSLGLVCCESFLAQHIEQQRRLCREALELTRFYIRGLQKPQHPNFKTGIRLAFLLSQYCLQQQLYHEGHEYLKNYCVLLLACSNDKAEFLDAHTLILLVFGCLDIVIKAKQALWPIVFNMTAHYLNLLTREEQQQLENTLRCVYQGVKGLPTPTPHQSHFVRTIETYYAAIPDIEKKLLYEQLPDLLIAFVLSVEAPAQQKKIIRGFNQLEKRKTMSPIQRFGFFCDSYLDYCNRNGRKQTTVPYEVDLPLGYFQQSGTFFRTRGLQVTSITPQPTSPSSPALL